MLRPSTRPRIAIATPAAANANNGNWRTAERWAGFLAADADVRIHADGNLAGLDSADALIALHAVKSRAAVERYRAARAGRGHAPVAVVLTGTDVYGDGDGWRHAAESASAIVVLQPAALDRLDGALRAKGRVILQSASGIASDKEAANTVAGDGLRVAFDRRGRTESAARHAPVVAVGHLRAVKDPRTLWRAARRLCVAGPSGPAIRIDHVGAALEPALADEARATEAACGGAFRWRGALDHAATRQAIAAARLLVHPSLVEGGAHVLVEAIVSGTAVVASRIDGNTGLLGADHPGLFVPGDDAALAALVRRFFAEPAFAAGLVARSAALAPAFAPEAERAAVRTLARELLAAAGGTGERR